MSPACTATHNTDTRAARSSSGLVLCSCSRNRNVRPDAGALLDQVPGRGAGKRQRRDAHGRCVRAVRALFCSFSSWAFAPCCTAAAAASPVEPILDMHTHACCITRNTSNAEKHLVRFRCRTAVRSYAVFFWLKVPSRLVNTFFFSPCSRTLVRMGVPPETRSKQQWECSRRRKSVQV